MVNTPKATGISASIATFPKPLLASPATYSKCAVPPRITVPNATIASNFLLSAKRRATNGNSYAPGARTIVIFSSFTWPIRFNASIAPSNKLSLIKLLKRAIATATFALGAATEPSKTFIFFPIKKSLSLIW